MSCCAPGTEASLDLAATAGPGAEEIRLSSRALDGDLMQTDLAVPGMHCGACMQAIESALGKLDGVAEARANLSTKRVSVKWHDGALPPLVDTLNRLGYPPHLIEHQDETRDETLAELIRAVAISGFAAGNIMLLSVSVWSGAEAATRDLFHWISALIALPALAFAGRIFFRSAWNALRHGRTNMDVPIAIGVSLAYGLSLYETINHGEHAYFDASVTLLFFLLIGRTLDHVMRQRARMAVTGLARLAPRGAMVLKDDGGREYIPLPELLPDMRILIAAGERIPVDGVIVEGNSELDCSMATGESAPVSVGTSSKVRAGTLNLTQPLIVRASAAAKDSFLAEMIRLMEAAESGRARYRRIADRAAALYAPVVHATAFLTFLGWIVATGDLHRSVTIAIAVLIITCPCALGLAVPIVQVVAARRLFESGIMVKDGAAMERLAEIDTAAFDKTGTLTLGTLRLVNARELDGDTLAMAAAIAAHSRHPLSRAIVEAAGKTSQDMRFATVREFPGQGVEAIAMDGTTWRLGRADWACKAATATAQALPGTRLSRNGREVACLEFEDRIRPDAGKAIAELKSLGLSVELMSGDGERQVATLADKLSIPVHRAGMLPDEKSARLSELAARGHKVLMVGDGLNDAPALAGAHVSMAPASAADIGRNAADFVFLHESLSAVPLALDVSRRAERLVRQNFALAIGYNVLAVPIAVMGHVTPLVAAIAMSGSSLVVIGNALRLTWRRSASTAQVALAGPRTMEAAS